ncbi:MAG: hypothetical protein KBS75_02490 [Bacteroidales bacterium]|nr:hypothetical protein [Candidatus Equimonas faecalis]
MQATTLNFPHSVRTTYTAIKRLFEMKRTKFSSVKYNDELFIVEARQGAWISPFSENVKMKVVATSSQTCKVVIESSSRSILNLLNFGANKGNVSDLSDYINNEVYKLCQPGEIPMENQGNDHSTIRIVTPEIRFK